MRVYHSIFAAMAKSLARFNNRTGADKKWSRISARAAAVAHRRLVRKLCFVVGGSLLVTASFSTPQRIGGSCLGFADERGILDARQSTDGEPVWQLG